MSSDLLFNKDGFSALIKLIFFREAQVAPLVYICI